MKNRIFYLLLTLLGVSVSGCMRVEYGTPHVHFNLKARVIDEAGKPIEGIEARAKSNYSESGIPFESRTGESNYLGEIDATSGDMWHGMQHEIIFLDPDGEANGGKFATKVVDISEHVIQTDAGDGNWDNGSYKADIGDVVMTIETPATEPEDDNL